MRTINKLKQIGFNESKEFTEEKKTNDTNTNSNEKENIEDKISKTAEERNR